MDCEQVKSSLQERTELKIDRCLQLEFPVLENLNAINTNLYLSPNRREKCSKTPTNQSTVHSEQEVLLRKVLEKNFIKDFYRNSYMKLVDHDLNEKIVKEVFRAALDQWD